MQVGQLAEHLAVLGVQAFDETGVVQPGLAVRFVQIAKLVQALHDRQASRRRKLLPTWKQRLPNFPLLVGSHLLPDSLAFAEFLLLRRSQLIPGLQALADSRLLVRRQISTCPKTGEQNKPAARKAAKAAPNWKRSFII